ncbi:exported hypothetical protein [metagenome]|uniref:Uncharacterized protein n=1 Tax=metagenome TaxID=256318 RepID=A0A2P2CHT0_9ZZZZ
MPVNAAPSGSWWKVGAATMALATTCAVTSCSSNADDTAAPDTPGGSDSHSAHEGATPAPPQPLRTGERFVDLEMAEAYTPAPPEGAMDEYRCQVLDPGLTEEAFLTGTPGHAGQRRHRAPRHRVRVGARRRCRGSRARREDSRPRLAVLRGDRSGRRRRGVRRRGRRGR